MAVQKQSKDLKGKRGLCSPVISYLSCGRPAVPGGLGRSSQMRGGKGEGQVGCPAEGTSAFSHSRQQSTARNCL